MHLLFFKHNCFWLEYCTGIFSIISFVAIISMLLLVGYVPVSETIRVRLSQRNQDCYCDYYFILIVLNQVRFRLRLGCPGSLMSLYCMGPHFMLLLSIYVLYSNVTYIYPVSCLVEIKLFQIVSLLSLLSEKGGDASLGESDLTLSVRSPSPTISTYRKK